METNYYEVVNQANDNDLPPLVIYTYRAKHGVHLPDLVDLRFIRELYLAGVSVSVLVLDIPFKGEDRDLTTRNSARAVKMIDRFLGSQVRVNLLSLSLGSGERESIRYIFDHFLPLVADDPSGLRAYAADTNGWNQARAIHFLSQALVLRAIESIRKGMQQAFVIRWCELHKGQGRTRLTH